MLKVKRCLISLSVAILVACQAIAQCKLVYTDTLKLLPDYFQVDSLDLDSSLITRYGYRLRAYIGLEIEDNGAYYWDSAVVDINAVMYCERSYISPDAISDEGVMRHELYHFKIAELFARKYRKILSTTSPISPETHMEIKKRIMMEYQQYQEEYDVGVNYYSNKRKQKEWERKIDLELQELEDFKNPRVVVHYR